MLDERKLKTNKHRLSSAAINLDPMVLLGFALMIAICMFPEISLAGDLVGVTAEGQLDKVGTLANGKLKTVGLSLAAVIGGITSVMKGNISLALIIIGICIALALMLEWIAGGMKLMA